MLQLVNIINFNISRRANVVDIINVTLKGLRAYDRDLVCSEVLRSVKCTWCFFFENIININVMCTVMGNSVLWKMFICLYGSYWRFSIF